MDFIPTAVKAALDLFENNLGDLRFGDIDAKTLARSAADVREVAAVVASAQASLDSAQRALEERQDALLDQVQRAVAYARVYADNDEPLRQKLEAIRLPRATRAPRSNDEGALVLSPAPQAAPRRAGRPRKTPVSERGQLADTGTGGVRAGGDERNDVAAMPE